MTQKSPDELCAFAKEVAQNTRKPFDDILLRETKTETITTEYKGGFLNLITKTKQETQKYVETKKYPINCWILEKYTEKDVENDYYFSEYIYYYVLSQNGDLNVITLNTKGWGNTFYENSSATIEDMTFLTPRNYTIPITRVALDDLLWKKSAYQLDVAHLNWKVDKGNGDYIVRDHPYTLLSEGYLNGAGEYKYSQGEGIYLRLKSLMT